MAFGFPPKYTAYFAIDTLTPEQFLVLALEAAKQQDWNIGYTSQTGFLAYTKRTMRSYGEEIKVVLDNGIATVSSACTGNQLFDWGKNKKNVDAFFASFEEVKTSLSPEELAQKHAALQPGLASNEADVLTAPKEGVSSFLSVFIPRPGFFITPLLIDINILFFVLMAVSGVSIWSPTTQDLLQWGANFKPATLEGEWWRLLTNCFVHIGLIHLLMNMYALLYIGLMLEPHLGKLRFAAAYLLTGIAASLTSLWWHDLTVSAGASGAIFGLYGVFFAMLTTNFIEKAARKQLLTSIGLFIGYNLLNGMKGGVDNAAHIGGLVSGLLAGYLFYPTLKHPSKLKLQYASVALLAVLVLCTTIAVYRALPNDIAQYDKRIQAFAGMEAEAMSVYQLPENTPKEKQLSTLKEKGMRNWNESIRLIGELDKLNLPATIHQRDKALLKYCELRLKSCELVYKAIEENTNQYNTQIEGYNTDIEATMASLKTE